MGRRLAALSLLLAACGGAPAAQAPAAEAPRTMTTFEDDLAFLSAHGRPIVLSGEGGGVIAVSAEHQGRVMTSGVARSGRSLGWINRSFIAAGKTGTPFDNFGGEDRFWLGPEGGQFGLYFAPGAPFEFDAWQTPHELQEGAWTVAASDASSVTLTRRMKVQNWSGTSFDVDVTRTVRLLGRRDVTARLGVEAPPSLVAYESENRVTNAGRERWSDDTGLLSIWILAMYAPAADARVVIPFEKDGEGPVVNDDYFGKVPPDRLEVRREDGVILFFADGKERGKIGLSPSRAKDVLGSYSAEAELLTIVQYDRPRAPGARYVDSAWKRQADPFAGDVVNSYNDGPPGPGKPPLGGFYELETSSPALALAPGESATHTHRTFHFVGARAVLDPIARRVLGTALPGR